MRSINNFSFMSADISVSIRLIHIINRSEVFLENSSSGQGVWGYLELFPLHSFVFFIVAETIPGFERAGNFFYSRT